jgi:hypothetical protein
MRRAGGNWSVRSGAAEPARLRVIARRTLPPLRRWLVIAISAGCFVGMFAPVAQATPGVVDYFGNSTVSGGTAGGLFESTRGPKGVAVYEATGDIYVADTGSNRIQRFTNSGDFVEAWGFDVALPTSPAASAVFEVCTVATNCKAGVSTGVSPVNGLGRQLSLPAGIAIDQATGHLYVVNTEFRRIEVFTATGAFVRAFGRDVVQAGKPDNVVAQAEQQTLTVDASAGQYKLSFRGQTTADLSFNATAAQVDSALEALSTIGAGNVTVTGGPGATAPLVVAFSGALTNSDQPAIATTAGTTPLSGGTATANVATTQPGSNDYEVCSVAADCKVGTVGAIGGALPSNGTGANAARDSLTLAPAGAPNAGNLLVTNVENRRVQEFTPGGAFVRAFGRNVLPATSPGNVPGNERQIVTLGGATGGTFALRFGGPATQTGAIPYDATAGQVQSSLEGPTTVGPGRVSVTGPAGGPWVVEFIGALSDTDTTQLTVETSGLVGTPSATVVTTTVAGGFEVCRASAFDICQAGVVALSSASRAPGQFGSVGLTGIAEDGDGNIYTSEEAGSFQVQKFSLPGNEVTAQGPLADTILTGSASSSKLTDVEVDGAGNVYVAKSFEPGTGEPPVVFPSGVVSGTPSVQRILKVDPAADGGNGEVVDTMLVNPHEAIPLMESISGLTLTTAGSIYFATRFSGGNVRSIVYRLDEIGGLTVTAMPASEVKATTATLNATVTPAEVQFGTSYYFEYSTNGVTWQRAAEQGVDLGNGSGAGDPSSCPVGNPPTCDISQEIADLELGVTYQYRVVAETPFRGASAVSSPGFFTTAPASPEVRTGRADWSSGPDTDPSLTLRGRINAQGTRTAYRFEYVSQAEFDQSGYTSAASAPVDGAEAGHGTANRSVIEVVEGLDRTVAYHYRLVATNPEGTAVGADRTVQPPAGTDRFVELVTDGDSSGVGIAALRPSISDDGNRVMFQAQGFGDPTGLPAVMSGFISQRGEAGWDVAQLQLSSDADGGDVGEVAYASAELDRVLWGAATAGENARGELQWRFSELDGGLTPAGPRIVPFDRTAGALDWYRFRGGSNDLSTFVFSGPVSSSFSTAVTLFPGEAFIPPTTGLAYSNLYGISGAGGPNATIGIVNRATDGTQIGGACGARLGGITMHPFGQEGGRADGSVRTRAVSEDGSVVHFSARAAAGADSCDPLNDRVRVFKRVDDSSTVAVSESQCTRTASDVGGACSAADGDDYYQGASADGSVSVFTTPRQLVGSSADPGDTDSTEDLYVYDSTPPAGQPSLIQASAGEVTADHPTIGAGADVRGVVDIAADGSRVYFVAAGRLTADAAQGANNLYVFERSDAHPAGRIAFVAVLTPGPTPTSSENGAGDSDLWYPRELSQSIGKPAYALPFYDTSGAGRVAGDGRYLVFEAQAALLAEDGDTFEDIYRYDAVAEELMCLTCSGDGSEDALLYGRRVAVAYPDYVQQHRIASEDVSAIVFTTAESLAAEDTNTAYDVYEWRGGVLRLISAATGDDGVVPAGRDTGAAGPSISPDGDTIFFVTRASLLPADINNGGYDIYAARVGGGFPLAASRAACDALAGDCQGGGSDPASNTRRTTQPSAGDAVATPRARLAIGRPSAKALRRAAVSGRLAVTIRMSGPGIARVSAVGRVGRRATTLGVASKRFARPGAAQVVIELSRSAKRALAQHRHLALRVTARSADIRPRSVRVVLRRTGK